MKVKTITRSAETTVRERKGDIFIVKRNPDPALHPFQRAREYTRALNAAKLDRLFAKPFVAALSGHADGVYCMNRHPNNLKLLCSASADGEVRVWDMGVEKRMVWGKRGAHEGFVKGVCFLPEDDQVVLSCGDDKVVRMWDYRDHVSDVFSRTASSTPPKVLPVATFQGKGTFTGIDGHRHGKMFATSGSEEVAIWDRHRAEPIQCYSWGADTINAVRFNQAEVSMLASVASDRSIQLHDIRLGKSIAKIIQPMRANSLAWNPQEAIYFSVASEDCHVYTFDMRYLGEKAVGVFRGHVSAVIDLDYSPTGVEIATAGYDRSLRVFNAKNGYSRDIYHSRRMQRLFCVRYSMDSKYIMSGSDDGNIRIWKSNASESMGVKNHRQAESLSHQEALIKKYRSVPEIKRIVEHRRIPKDIKLRTRTEAEHRQSQARKDENRRKNSRPGQIPPKKTLKESAILDVKQ